jgi:hypothetical protein
MRYDHESMLPERAFMKVGGRMTLEGGKGGAPAAVDLSQMADATRYAADKAAMYGKDYLDWTKSVYAQNQPRQDQLYDLAARTAEQQMDIASQNQGQAKAQWDYYNSTFKPVEQKMVQDAMNYDSQARQNEMAGKAVADVKTQMAGANAAQDRALLGMGVNPNSGRFAGLKRQQAIMGGAATAGAATNARSAVIDRGIGLRAGAASFGRNMPNTAAQAYGLATGAGSSAVGNMNTGANSGLGFAQLVAGGYGGAMNGAAQGINANLGIGNMYNQQYATQMNAYGQQQAGQGAMIGTGLGAAATIGAAAL